MGGTPKFLNVCFFACLILAGVLIANIPTSSYAADETLLFRTNYLNCVGNDACRKKVKSVCADSLSAGLCEVRTACGDNQACLGSLKTYLAEYGVSQCGRLGEISGNHMCDPAKLSKVLSINNLEGIAAASTWQPVSGKAFDVSIGGDGSIWHVGGNGSLYRKMPKDARWAAIHKGSRTPNRHVVQVEAQNKDRAFVRTKDNNMWIVDKGKPWENVAGAASYIASNAKNELYHLGLDGKTVYRYEYNPNYKKFWHKFNGVITQISVGPNGNLWGVGTNKGIYQRKSKQVKDTWHRYPGATSQVSVSSTGNVWHIGRDSRTAYHLQANSKNWQEINPAPEKLIDIAAGPHGELWGIGQSHKMYVIKTKQSPSLRVSHSLR